MSTRTPGQAAYEASGQVLFGLEEMPLRDFSRLPARLRDAWEAAGQAAVDESDSTALGELSMARDAISDLASQRDSLRQQLAAVTDENAVHAALADMKALLSEVLSEFYASEDGYCIRVSPWTYDRWLSLAGIEAL